MVAGRDDRLMLRALQLARRARYWARPNPHVGCVLWRDGLIIGEGFTQPAGSAHAEVMALAAAGDARGSTAYVSLEPCSHTGRTGPCADALVAAGVERVVCALRDPNPQVSGRGMARLREAGVEVLEGVAAQAAEAELAGFLARMRRGRGRVRLKLAMSLDGRTAMASGESQWITGPEARRDVQRLRAASCAILTGSGTAISDDCALTVRREALEGLVESEILERMPAPLRVLLDRDGEVPPTAKIHDGSAPTLLFHASDASVPAGIRGQPVALTPEGRLDLDEVFAALAARSCNEILVECGPRLAGVMLLEGRVDQLVVYMAPLLLGSSARPLMDFSLERLADGVPLRLRAQRRVGEDLRLTFEPERGT